MSSPLRRSLISLFVVGALLAMSGTWSSAATVNGITQGKFGALQAFGVQRSPAFPTCDNGTSYDPLTVFGPSDPFSDSVGGPVALGTNYLTIQPSGDSGGPWAIAMFNAAGEELRWTGSAWVTAAQVGGFTSQLKFAERGIIYGVSTEGFLHASQPQDFGTFISPNSVLGDSRTYTPEVPYNECISGLAIGANLQNLPVNDTPITPTTSTTSTSTTSTTAPIPTTSTTVTPPAPGPGPSPLVTPRFTG